MEKDLDIYDEVIIKKNRVKTHITEVINYDFKKLDNLGRITYDHLVRYRLNNYNYLVAPEDIVYVGMTPKKEEEIDKILIDAYLKERNFEAIRQIQDTKKKK